MIGRIKPRRRIAGMAAVLLPLADDGAVDWAAFVAHVERTAAAGLTPAVNMDTGYVSLLDPATRRAVLDTTRATGVGFVAGAYVDDTADEPGGADAHRRAVAEVAASGGTPIVFPSHGLAGLDEDAWVHAHAGFRDHCERFYAFELGTMFLPQGRILSADGFRALLGIRACAGAKHSSLSRRLEWERLEIRDEHRPEFQLLTGNDLAIDMVQWGSDYLLGLATFAPDEFAARDRRWAEGDVAGFLALNDALQAIGSFAFRAPVPAYRHDAAMCLHLRGWAATDRTHPSSPRRPTADREVLAGLLQRLAAQEDR
jgi:dihydrodipicolinate synthase/N-acetylneuraminate lyase